MNLHKNKVFVQIGTYNGKDKFNLFARQFSPEKVILVEPNKSLEQIIKYNYRKVEHVYLESVAITAEKTGNVKLVVPNKLGYSDGHFTFIPMDGWGEDLKQMEVPSMTFQELCEKYQITHIHYLEIDTEGYDSEIIKSIDFNNIKIDYMQYEFWGFNKSYFVSYGKDAVKYGRRAMKSTRFMLESLGYKLTRVNGNVIAEYI